MKNCPGQQQSRSLETLQMGLKIAHRKVGISQQAWTRLFKPAQSLRTFVAYKVNLDRFRAWKPAIQKAIHLPSNLSTSSASQSELHTRRELTSWRISRNVATHNSTDNLRIRSHAFQDVVQPSTPQKVLGRFKPPK